MNLKIKDLFDKFINESLIILTDEDREVIKSNSDVFGVGDFDQEEMESGHGFTQEEFDDIVDNAETIGELIHDIDKEFGLNSREVIEDLL